MTKEEYAIVCQELQIEFRETDRVANQEQLAVKAQLLQRYYLKARAMVRANSATPEIDIYLNGRVVSVNFLDDINYIFWMNDVFPNFPKWKDIPKHADFFPLEQVIAKTAEIIGF